MELCPIHLIKEYARSVVNEKLVALCYSIRWFFQALVYIGMHACNKAYWSTQAIQEVHISAHSIVIALRQVNQRLYVVSVHYVSNN